MRRKVIGTFIFIAVLVVAYFGGVGYYADRFQANTQFGSVAIGNKTIDEAKQTIEEEMNKTQVTVQEDGKELGVLTLGELDGDMDIDAVLAADFAKQDPAKWPIYIFSESKFKNNLAENITVNDEKLTKVLEEMGLKNDERTPAKNAEIEFSEEEGFYVKPEEAGNQLDNERVKAHIVEALQTGEDIVDVKMAYLEPEVKSEDEAITSVMDRIHELSTNQVVWEIAGKEEVIEGDLIEQWIYFDDANNLVINKHKVAEYIDSIAEKYETYDIVREFESTLRGTVEVLPGTLGWSIDSQETAAILANHIVSGAEGVVEPVVNGTGYGSGDPNSVGDDYIEIDLQNQHMWLYKDGKLVMETPIVSGFAGSSETIPGAYAVWSMDRNATLVGTNVQLNTSYRQPVSWWIPFDDTGQGIHDANWQGSFGGNAYTYAGSQGCINVPPHVMADFFEEVELGMPVMIYN